MQIAFFFRYGISQCESLFSLYLEGGLKQNSLFGVSTSYKGDLLLVALVFYKMLQWNMKQEYCQVTTPLEKICHLFTLRLSDDWL